MSNRALFIAVGRSLPEAISRVRFAEAAGYRSAWVAQISDRDATITCAAFSAATSKLGIGTGILPIYPRTPAAMIQMAASLDELSGGRFILGVGPSHKVVIENWHGMKLDRPLASIREYVGAMRAILQKKPFEGEIYRTNFDFTGFEPPRRDLPIYISCLSPKMCQLAGEIADGGVLWMCSPDYVREVVVPNIEIGRKKAGLSMEGFEIVAAVSTAITENKAAARDAFRKASFVYWTLPFYRAAIENGGMAEDLAAFDAQGPSGVRDETIDKLAGIGTAEDANRVIESYVAAGVTLPGISFLPRHEGGASFEETLEAVAPR